MEMNETLMTPEALEVTQSSAIEIDEPAFWELVEKKEVQQVTIVSWSGKQMLASLVDGTFVGVKEDSDTETIRERLLDLGVKFSYPAGDGLSKRESLEKAEFGSESAVAAGLGMSLLIGAADVLLEIGIASAGPAVLTAVDLEAQSLLEKETIPQALAEDVAAVGRAVQEVEKLGAAEVKEIGAEVGSVGSWFQRAAEGLISNHAPGAGGWIEDGYMAILTFVSLFSLYQMAFLKRKANTWSGLFHTATGAMQIGVVLFAVVE